MIWLKRVRVRHRRHKWLLRLWSPWGRKDIWIRK